MSFETQEVAIYCVGADIRSICWPLTRGRNWCGLKLNLDFSNYDKDLNTSAEFKKRNKEDIEDSKPVDEYASSEKAVIPENIEYINYDGVSEILEYNAEDLVTIVEDIES